MISDLEESLHASLKYNTVFFKVAMKEYIKRQFLKKNLRSSTADKNA